jgi:segregation and condensation protein B
MNALLTGVLEADSTGPVRFEDQSIPSATDPESRPRQSWMHSRFPIVVLRLAEAAVFASPEPLTWQKLQPLLPRDLDPGIVFAALERHCADRGVILVRAGEGWTFRTAPDLAHV